MQGGAGTTRQPTPRNGGAQVVVIIVETWYRVPVHTPQT